jgi:hypothetical protein
MRWNIIRTKKIGKSKFLPGTGRCPAGAEGSGQFDKRITLFTWIALDPSVGFADTPPVPGRICEAFAPTRHPCAGGDPSPAVCASERVGDGLPLSRA